MPVKYKFPYILEPDYKHTYSEEEQKELVKCAMDVVYFAENFYTIIDADPNSIETEKIIELYDFQKNLLKGFQNNQFSIILSARQAGKTTISCVFLLWYSIFNENKEIGILANQHSTAIEIISDIKKAYELLPPFLKHGVKEYNKTNIEWSNGSKIFAKATSEDALRGHTMSLVFLDEFAFVPQNVSEGFWRSNYPTISKSNGKIIIVSTPNGNAGLYYEMWKKAEDGKTNFVPYRINWWEVPGRDEKWKEEQIKNIGLVRWNSEFGCSFEGSSQTLIKPESLGRQKGKEPIYVEGNHYKVWKAREKKRVYGISIDASQGTYGNYSVINIFDITEYPYSKRYEQVALWRRNDTPIFEFCDIILTMCKFWNNAPVIVENNGGIGEAIVRYLFKENDYEFVYFDADKGNHGVNANIRTKPLALGYMQEDFDKNNIIINSDEGLKEFSYYEEQKEGVYKAKVGKGYTDDIVSTTYWMAYFLRSAWWQNNFEYIFQLNEITDFSSQETKWTYDDHMKLMGRAFSDQYNKEMSDFERDLSID